MKACPHCAEEIQDAAKVCKHCGRTVVSRVGAVMVSLTVLALIVAIIGAGAWVYWSLAQQPTPAAAYEVCQRYVAARLPSPGAARFPAIHEAGVTVATGGDDFVVRGVVDAPNGFGTVVRTRFVCTVRYEENNQWWLSELLMGDEAPAR